MTRPTLRNPWFWALVALFLLIAASGAVVVGQAIAAIKLCELLIGKCGI